MKPSEEPNRDTILTDDAVAEYLAGNPGFFVRHPDLLSDLDLPCETGGSVSLLERQVMVLRERNRDVRERLNALLENAADNERAYVRMKTLTLALMDAGSASDLDAALHRDLIAGFEADHATCFVKDWTEPEGLGHLIGIAVDETPPLAQMFEQSEPLCAVHRAEEYAALFPGTDLTGPGSVAMVPLRTDAKNAVLVIGSWDPRRFTPDMGKVFLVHIGEVMSRTLARILHQAASALGESQ